MAQEKSVCILRGPFGRATVNPSTRALVEHTHRQINILIKLGGGDAVFVVAGERLVLDDHSILLFNSWLPHAKLANEDDASLILSLFIDPEWMAANLAHAVVSMEAPFALPRAELYGEIKALAVQLGSAIASQARSPEDRAEALLGCLVQMIGSAYGSTDDDFRQKRWMIDYRIRRAINYLHEHTSHGPSIVEVARHVGLSRSRFFEQFRNCVGVTPQQYMDHLRMTSATHLLTSSDMPLAELACELGFAGHSNFTRFFTQHIGVPPNEFRRQTRANIPPAELTGIA